MKVALVGSGGNVGHRLIPELKSRGHSVTGLARTPPAGETAVPMLAVDANDADVLAKAISGNDALIVSGRFVSMKAEPILQAMVTAGVARLLVVGGAGTLFVAPGLQLIDSPGFPEVLLPEVSGGRDFLTALKASSVDWTFLSPALNFAAGKRTGTYRLGGDDLMCDASGNSSISYEDLAKAMVDELEVPQHSRARFSIAY